MTRRHRAAHRLAWPLIGLAAGLALLIALVQRAPAAHGLQPETRAEASE